ncbi:MAG: glycosyltransferase family 2 protein [Verrucomicrobiae bacterium]|nr:glycosyltransferase family 2 protein [Verrucomicrobiae bacterium]
MEQEAVRVPPPPRLQRIIRVVLPAFNEEKALVPLTGRIRQMMVFHGLDYEITVVDDGSSDDTLKVAKECAREMPIRILRHLKNAGLGATIRDGLIDAVKNAGEHDIIITMDADNSHTPGLILRMVRLIDEGCDVVIASRFTPGARVLGVSFFRQILSIGASWMVRLLLPIPGVKDFTCGFRAYRADILREAFAKYQTSFIEQEGFQCMVDILLKLRDLDLVFGEVPLIHRYDLKPSSSKMNVGRTVMGTIKLLLSRRFGSR